MKKTKRPLNTWAFLGIYLAILAVFAGVYALTKAINKPVPIVGTGSYTPAPIPASARAGTATSP